MRCCSCSVVSDTCLVSPWLEVEFARSSHLECSRLFLLLSYETLRSLEEVGPTGHTATSITGGVDIIIRGRVQVGDRQGCGRRWHVTSCLSMARRLRREVGGGEEGGRAGRKIGRADRASGHRCRMRDA